MPRRLLILAVLAALAGCGAGKPAAHGALTTAQPVGVPEPSGTGPAGPIATPPPAASPPHTTRPPRPSRPPTPTTSTTTGSPTPSPVDTTATLPKIVSWTILYKGFELTDFVLNDHGDPACAQTTWSLKMVISPGDVPFRLYIELDGSIIYDAQEPDGLADPTVIYRPVRLDGPHDVSAGLHLQVGPDSDNRYVHFACRAA